MRILRGEEVNHVQNYFAGRMEITLNIGGDLSLVGWEDDILKSR